MAVDAVKAGAVDFLTKPLEAEALLPPRRQRACDGPIATHRRGGPIGT